MNQLRRKHMNEKLLREYVRSSLLIEDDGGYGGDFSGMDAGMAGPYGMRFGTDQDMYDTFIGPFVDVFKTTVGKTKELSKKTQTLLWVGLQSILTTIIPIYGYNYAEVFDKEKEAIDNIKAEYSEVYKRTEDALGSGDAALLAFMACPSVVLSVVAAKSSAKVTKELFSAVTGGESDDIYGGIKNAAKSAGRWALGNDGHGEAERTMKKNSRDPKDFNFSGVGESQLVEDDDQKKQKADITPEKILKSKKMLSKVVANPKVQEMQKKATEIYRKSLKEVYSQAEELFKKVHTVQDIEKLAGSKLKGDVKAKIEEIKKLPPNEKTKAEKMLIDGSKKAMKDFYEKALKKQVEEVIKAGIPEDAQYVKDFRSVMQKIQAL